MGSACSGSRTTSSTGTCIRTVRIGQLERPHRLGPEARASCGPTRACGSSRSCSTTPTRSAVRRASNLLGVLSIVAFNAQGAGGGGAPDRTELLLNAVASFRQAIEFDPDNADAKFNLEAAPPAGRGAPPDRGRRRQEAPGRRSRLARRGRRRARQRLLGGRAWTSRCSPRSARLSRSACSCRCSRSGSCGAARGEVRRAIKLPEPSRFVRGSPRRGAARQRAALLGLAAAQPPDRVDVRPRRPPGRGGVRGRRHLPLDARAPPARCSDPVSARRRRGSPLARGARGVPRRDRVVHRSCAAAPLPDDGRGGLPRDASTLDRHRPAAAARHVRYHGDAARVARDHRQPALLLAGRRAGG